MLTANAVAMATRAMLDSPRTKKAPHSPTNLRVHAKYQVKAVVDDQPPVNDPKLRDPARALRRAVRTNDYAKVDALLDWLLKKVPLAFSDATPIVTQAIVRGSVDPTNDGFAFDLDPRFNGAVTGIRNQSEVQQLAPGDRIVSVDGVPVTRPLREVVPPESVATLGVWKRSAMLAQRARLARGAIDDAFLEVGIAATGAAAVKISDRLLRCRANVRHADEKGLTALHWAAFRGQLETVELLLRHGAPVEGRTPPPPGGPSAPDAPPTPHTPLQLAVIGGHGAVMRTLLHAGADPLAPAAGGRQLIHLAALGPCESMVELLVDPDAAVGGRQQLEALSGKGWTALFLAAADDNLPMVKALLAIGSPLGKVLHGRPLLHHAASCGAAAVVRWLGAECSAQLPINATDAKGRTPLRLACERSHMGAAESLIALGASPAIDAHLILDDPSVTEDVRMLVGTAVSQWQRQRSALLLIASAHGDVAAMRALHVDQGAEIMHHDERGYTALHHAAANGREDAALYLLQTPEGARLIGASTRDAGKSANWMPVDLATTEKLKSLLLDFAKGGEERSRILARARKRLAAHVGAARRMAESASREGSPVGVRASAMRTGSPSALRSLNIS